MGGGGGVEQSVVNFIEECLCSRHNYALIKHISPPPNITEYNKYPTMIRVKREKKYCLSGKSIGIKGNIFEGKK